MHRVCCSSSSCLFLSHTELVSQKIAAVSPHLGRCYPPTHSLVDSHLRARRLLPHPCVVCVCLFISLCLVVLGNLQFHLEGAPSAVAGGGEREARRSRASLSWRYRGICSSSWRAFSCPSPTTGEAFLRVERRFSIVPMVLSRWVYVVGRFLLAVQGPTAPMKGGAVPCETSSDNPRSVGKCVKTCYTNKPSPLYWAPGAACVRQQWSAIQTGRGS